MPDPKVAEAASYEMANLRNTKQMTVDAVQVFIKRCRWGRRECDEAGKRQLLIYSFSNVPPKKYPVIPIVATLLGKFNEGRVRELRTWCPGDYML